jgi:DNA-3-methyladenine glycosylase I
MSGDASLVRSHADGKRRCVWCGDDPLYVAYHDDEWGKPVHDDIRLFEKICLEGFQSGLSWLTILRKRERFRHVFAGFDPDIVARFGEQEIDRLLTDPGIVRHRGKIESTINNARRYGDLVAERSSLDAFVWDFVSATPEHRTAGEVPTRTPSSTRLSKELKKRGWSFVGPTTLYAFMQSVGMVNDHAEGCWAR